MKVDKKIVAVMALMASGVALADYHYPPEANTSSTAAGLLIENTATAAFINPFDSTKTESVTSNTVITKVLPLPMFDVTYADGTGDGSGATDPLIDNSVYANSASMNTPKYVDYAVANQIVDTNYALVNYGNTDIVVHVNAQFTANLDANKVTYSFPNGTALTNVVYDVSGTKIISADVTLPQGKVINFVQTVVVPTGLAAGTILGATPVGVAYNNAANANNGLPADMQEDQSVDTSGATPVVSTFPDAGTDLQYTAIRLYISELTNNPNGSADGSTTAVSNTVTPPVDTYGSNGYVSDPSTATTTDPVNIPAGTDTTTKTTIVIKGDTQYAFPPADDNNTDDVVTFTNSVHNSSINFADLVNLFPSDALGNPVGIYNSGTGVFTLPSGIEIQFLNPATGDILPTGADGYPTISVEPGADAPYLTKITYPDSNSLANQASIPITIGVDSSNDAGVVADDLTYDTIYPPAAQFGDTQALTSSPLAVNPNPTPEKAVSPNTAVTTPTTSPSYPMTVANTGTYPDTYKLAGAVTILLTDGTTKVYPINYAGATIDPAYTGGTNPLTTDPTTPGTSPVVVNGVTYYAPSYTTATVAANSATTGINASVPVPYNAAITTGTGPASATNTNPEPQLQQTATGVYSTIAMTDTNDLLKIAPVGEVVVGKFTKSVSGTAPAAGTQYAINTSGTTATVSTDVPAAGTVYVTNPDGYDGITPTSYAPGIPYEYQIIGKNGFSSPINNFGLKDILKSQMIFESATCNVYDATYPAATAVVTAGIVGTTAHPAPVAGATGATVECAPVTLQSGEVQVLEVKIKIN